MHAYVSNLQSNIPWHDFCMVIYTAVLGFRLRAKCRTHMVITIVVTLCVIPTGVQAELEAALEVNTSQSAELADLKEAAATMTHSHEVLTQELHSSNEQLQHAQGQLMQLSTARQQLQQQHHAQVVRCTELELKLNNSSSDVAELQGHAQAQTEAMSITRQELQGDFDTHAADQLLWISGIFKTASCINITLFCLVL